MSRVRLALGGAATLLLLPTLALTFVRVVPLTWGPALQLVAFAPYAVAPYTAAVVLFAVLALARGRGARSRPGLAAALALVGLVLHAWWLAPAWVGPPRASSDMAPMTVMTANLFEGRADPDTVVAAVRDEGVDLLVLEEVSDTILPALDDAGLAALLPYRIGAPDPDDPVGGTLVLSATELGAATRVDTYHQSWLVDRGGLRLLAVHPVAPLDAARYVQEMDTLVATAREAQPDLVVGDFNATRDHHPMRELAGAGYPDAATVANSGWQPTWPAHGLGPSLGPSSWGLALPPAVAIDHVLLGPDWTALSTRTLDLPGSDHRALLAEVTPR